MKNFKNLLWGLVLIGIGVIIGLNALKITNIDIFFSGWWTLFIIIPCFIGLFKEESKTGNIIGLLIGTSLLLACQDLLEFELVWQLMIPIVLVIIGLSIIFKDFLHGKVRQEMSKLKKNKDNYYCATFSSQKVNFDNEKFKGCSIDAVFGGVQLDLRESNITEDSIIDVSCVFGGVDIFVPSDIKVKVTSTPIFGGVDNKYRNVKNDKAKTIYVNATCIFGGVDIK